MGRMNIAKLREKDIKIEAALELRDKKGERGFRCVGCGQPVIAHVSGSDGKPHFEHQKANPLCKE